MSFINRELSWIEFNQRVLDEVKRPDKPLLERIKLFRFEAKDVEAITTTKPIDFFPA